MKTFYNDKMVADPRSYSLSPLKPKLMVDWVARQFPDTITDFAPVTREDLYLAHSKAYVDGVLDLQISNGFGTKSKDVADSLLYTVGSIVAAVESVLTEEMKVAFSPTSGFHHAGYNFGGGFCTFNGLMVALLHAKQNGLIDTATIIDGDMHWGDGTQDIIDKLGLDWVTHWTGPRNHGGIYKREFAEAVEACLSFDCTQHVVIYQAGADIHKDDPLGGLLHTNQMFLRDHILAKRLVGKVPLVWNLAGGYQYNKDGVTLEEKLEPVLKLHQTTYGVFEQFCWPKF